MPERHSYFTGEHMAELTMVKGNTTLIPTKSIPLGKEIQKGKTEEKNASSAFSDFLRASQKEGRVKEEIQAGKEKKDDSETETSENGVKSKKPEEKKAEKTEKPNKAEKTDKSEDKEKISGEEEMENLLLENSFLIRRDQLKAEMKTQSEEGAETDLLPEAVEEKAVTDVAESIIPKAQGISPKEGKPEINSEKNAFSLEEKAEEEKSPIGEKKEEGFGVLKEEIRPEKEEVPTKRVKKSEEKGGERIARSDVKKEETPLTSTLKTDAPIRKEAERVPGDEKVERMHLLTKEEALPKDVAEFLGEKIDYHKGELKIELEPRSLGQITVKLNFQSGKASIVIFAENPKTLHLLQNGAEDMARIVEQKTGEQTRVIVHEENRREELFRDNDSNAKENRDEAERRLREAEEEKKKNHTEGFIHKMRLGLIE
jgi:flagellar hook-length control protein fliK